MSEKENLYTKDKVGDNTDAKCPYCGAYVEGENYYGIGNGDNGEFECDSCGKSIHCSCEIIWTFEKK